MKITKLPRSLILILACVKIELSVAAPRSCSFTVPPQHERISDHRYKDDSIRNLVHQLPLHHFFRRQLQKSQRLSSICHHPNRSLQGTRFSLRFPTPDRVAAWYTSGQLHRRSRTTDDHTFYSDTLTAINDRHRCVFNHKLVGMTNPTLQLSTERDVVPIQTSCNSIAPLALSAGSSSSTPTKIRRIRKWSQLLTGLVQKCSGATSGGRVREVSITEESSSMTTPATNMDLWWPGMMHMPNKDWRILCFRQRVGKGRDCYERCRDAALAWEFRGERQGIVLVEETSRRERIVTTSNHRKASSCSLDARNIHNEEHQQDSQRSAIQRKWSGPGQRLVTYTSIPKRGGWIVPHLYTVNPVTVVYDLVDQRAPGTTYTTTAYATQAGHFLCGEERVVVCHRDYDDGVDVEILSVSRAADSVRGRLVWPFIGRMQRSFFRQQLDFLQGVAHGTDKRQVK